MSARTLYVEYAASSSDPGDWAVGRLREALEQRDLLAVAGNLAHLRLVVCDIDDVRAGALVARWREVHGDDLSATPEGFAIGLGGDSTLLVCAGGPRGLSYGVLDIADLIRYEADPLTVMKELGERLGSPRNQARGITRMLTTAATDLAWFRDRSFWPGYLDELTTQRFNRFSLGLGAGYDYLIDRRVTDNYLCFPYPFLLDVDGYAVHVDGVDPAERAQNLNALQFIAMETDRRGLDFGLGLWNHAYRYDPEADTERWPVRGLRSEHHAQYCRDALVALLQAVPQVRRLTLRVHFEGGVPEPTHEFWRVVLSRLPDLGRLIELDFHAKGVSAELMAVVTDLGLPLTLSTKHWGEHQGLPYHQASIRAKERRLPTESDQSQSSGTGHPRGRTAGTGTTSRRSFTRYGYGDYAHAERPYQLVHRVWPGTQRFLLWGDPVMAAGYGRHAAFAGALGLEWFEPLSFYGKKDSAIVGAPRPHLSRELYRADAREVVAPDWEKYRYTYRVIGRSAYDPDVDAGDLDRPVRALVGSAAPYLTSSLGAASRILPLITVAHAPSTACNVYWPEMPTPVPLVARTAPARHPLADHGWPADSAFDMSPPYSFGHVSPLDPELFYGVDEFVADLAAGERKAKHTPLEIADRLDALSDEALQSLARVTADDVRDEDAFSEVSTDILIQAHLGRHFAALTRAAVSLGLAGRGLVRGDHVLEHYRTAIAIWDELVVASAPYAPDLPFGQTDYSRGSWADRKPAMLADLAVVQEELKTRGSAHDTGAHDLTTLGIQPSPQPVAQHQPPSHAVPGEPLALSLWTDDPRIIAVKVRFRLVNQSLEYSVVDLTQRGHSFEGEVPTKTMISGYPLQYFFEIHSEDDAWPHPGLAARLENQPYYVVHRDERTRWGRLPGENHSDILR